ncbi:MAG: hypothetical protein MJ072_01425 [Clostridia bacterium]|nr:hypothetical protein [Clostridia bacterium]
MSDFLLTLLGDEEKTAALKPFVDAFVSSGFDLKKTLSEVGFKEILPLITSLLSMRNGTGVGGGGDPSSSVNNGDFGAVSRDCVDVEDFCGNDLSARLNAYFSRENGI